MPPPPPGQPGAPTYQGAPPPGYQAYAPYQPGQFGEVAGFGVRLGGWLLDGLLYGLLALLFVIPGIILLVSAFEDCVTIGNETICDDVNGGAVAGGVLLMLAGAVIVFIIYVRHLAKTGQTWGRRIVGIKVLSIDTGQPLGTGKAIGRTLFEWLISGQIFYLGYLWMLWDDNKQTWHDKIVRSQVYRA